MFKSDRSRWDAGRLLQTLSYFEVIPALNWIQNLFQGNPGDNREKPDGAKSVGVVLVIGATSTLGQCIVKQLISQGYKTKCIAENIETAREILGDETDLIVADIHDTDGFASLALANTRAIIHCAEAKWDNQQLENLLNLAAKYLPNPGTRMLFDFTHPSTELKDVWGAVDDVVMGGVSQSNMRLIEAGGLFAGNVSTANNGGFASVRSRNFDPAFDLSNYAGVKLRVRGDGQRYKFLLRNQAKWDGMAYSYSFDTVADTWIDVQIPFSAFSPVFRAKTVNDAPPLPTEEICSFQLMLSKFEYDGQLNPNFVPGGFNLQIESIVAYGGVHLPQFISIGDQSHLEAATMIRNSQIPYTILTAASLTDTGGGKEMMLTPTTAGEITGSISIEDVALLCVQTLSTSQACNRTAAVSSTNQPANDINWSQMFVRLPPDLSS